MNTDTRCEAKLISAKFQMLGDNLSVWDFLSSMTFPWLLMIFQSSMTFHDFSRQFYYFRFSRPCGNPVMQPNPLPETFLQHNPPFLYSRSIPCVTLSPTTDIIKHVKIAAGYIVYHMPLDIIFIILDAFVCNFSCLTDHIQFHIPFNLA